MSASRRHLSAYDTPGERRQDIARDAADGHSQSRHHQRSVSLDQLATPAQGPVASLIRPGWTALNADSRPQHARDGSTRDARGKPKEALRFINAVKILLYDFRTHFWSPSEPAMLRLMQSLETGMTRLQAHSTAPGWNDRLLINCFLTPRMHLELARTHASGAKFVRAFTLATANDWSTGESSREGFAIKFPKTSAGLRAAHEFATLFDSLRNANTRALEEQAQRQLYHAQAAAQQQRMPAAVDGPEEGRPSRSDGVHVGRLGARTPETPADISRKHSRKSIGSFVGAFGRRRKAGALMSPPRTFQPKTTHS